MQEYLMICNAPEDQEYVTRLKRDLKEQGIRVWGGGAGGTDSKYAVGVAEAIRNASYFIFVCSQFSVTSKMLKVELAAASRAKVPIIMIAVDPKGYHAIKQTKAKVIKIDSCQDYQGAFERLVDKIKWKPETQSDVDAKEGPDKGEGYVFLSYAEPDTPYMTQVKEFLTEKGFAYWEYQQSARDYQANLAIDLEKVLRGATATLTILSPSWKESTWSMREFLFSQQVGIPVFLLRFEDVEPTLAIADILYIDFLGDKEKGFRQLLVELNDLFKRNGQ